MYIVAESEGKVCFEEISPRNACDEESQEENYSWFRLAGCAAVLGLSTLGETASLRLVQRSKSPRSLGLAISEERVDLLL
jgi:hypothetical protein